MSFQFPKAKLGHVKAKRSLGTAVHDTLPKDEFARARKEITQWDGYAPTPLYRLEALATRLDVAEVLYKDEGPRFGLGSFKALGGAYAALRVLQREISARQDKAVSLEDIRNGRHKDACKDITLVSATDGNHGRSLAWGCQRFGSPCKIYIHAEVSEGRAQVMRDFGAEVIRIEGDYDASVVLAKSEAEKHGWFVVSDTSWPGYSEPPRDVMIGYGVLVAEICEALGQPPSHVLLQGGVGGMAAGIIAALRQHWTGDAPRVIVVESELSACLFESGKTGAATNVPIHEETIMAGLSCGEPSALAWDILDQETSDFLTIPDAVVAPTVRLLARPLGRDPVIEAGESAVAGLAAVIAARQDEALSRDLGLDKDSRVLLIGSEGVTDPEIFKRIMEGHDAL